MQPLNAKRINRRLPLLFVVGILATSTLAGEETSPSDRTFFENKIRPILVTHCYKCHASSAKELGGKLRLDTRQGVRHGGESGPAIVPGDPEASPIIQAMRYDGLEMPPDKRLPKSVVNDFVRWVRSGAFDPRSQSAAKGHSKKPTTLWSIQPRIVATPPKVRNTHWPRSTIDQFVLARMESAGLSPAPDADAATLVRRMFIDLIGLPPTFGEARSFAVAYRSNKRLAVESLVDQLLARPQFGERWGRYWLDVARYGESNGNDGLGRNPTFPHAWRYRDYVISSFNADVPYDRFLREQIAGDLLPSLTPTERDRNLIATGFLAMAAKPAKAMNNNFAMDVVADQIEMIGTGIMGLSVGCARCHDHKFDPVPMRDYYALAGIFTSTETMWGLAANEGLTAPKTDLHRLTATPRALPPQGFVETVLVLESNTGKPKKIPKPPWPVGTPLAMGVREVKKPTDCRINIKGDAKKLGKPVPRGFLSAFGTKTTSVNQTQSGRLQLANWLTEPAHPLTSRVIANRVWLHLFGTGIVRTPNDFGVYGQRPSHPKLLDYLANRLIADNWSLKKLIRTIVLSRVYQLSSHANGELASRDPENRFFTRHHRRRLDAESLRDRMLRASGQLNLQPGIGSLIRHRDILVNLAGSLHQPSNHRSIYLCYLRSSPPPELAPFDLPDFTEPIGQRETSTQPGHILHLMNSPFVVNQARHLARHVISHRHDQQARIRLAFRRTLLRDPSERELRGAVQLLNNSTNQTQKSEDKAWTSFCQALLMSSEFRYVD